MTDKLREYADKLYQFKNNSASINAFGDGFQLGAEFAEWMISKCTIHSQNGAYHKLAIDGKEYTTPELTELFINDKMKEK